MNDSKERAKTVAITGATGLLGRHLCDYFQTKGWHVNALVRDVSKYPFSKEGIHVFKCVLPDNIDLQSIKSVDVLIHCAYMTRFTNLEEAKRVNEGGTARLLNAARTAGVAQFVFVSSRAARPSTQSYYAQSKYKLESMMDMSRDLIIRPGLILANDGGLFHRIVNLVHRLPVIPAFGGGRQNFRTIHIDDLCKVFDWSIENNLRGIVVAADPQGITMKEMLRTVLDRLGKRKIILYVPVMPFILILQLLEYLKLKLPVSSENLRGLLNRDEIDSFSPENIKHVEVKIRGALESIEDLIKAV